MTPPLAALLAWSLAAATWQADVLSDDAPVRAPVLAHLRTKGRPGLYELQDLVNRAAGPGERARAIRALGELGDPEAEWALYLELKQPSPIVAAAAIRAATRLRLNRLQAAVVAHVGDPGEDLCAALGAAAPVFPRVLEAARAKLAEPRAEAQLAGLSILAAAGAVLQADEARRLLSSPLPLASLLAAEAIGGSDPAAAAAVEAGLAAGADPLGTRAAQDLARLGTPAANAALEALARTPDHAERAVAALAASPRGLPVLIGLRVGDASLRPLIDRSLASCPPPVDVVLAVVGSADEGMARAAVALLAQRPDGVSALARCVEALAPQARRCALGLAAPASAEALNSVLASADEQVRALAVGALAEADERPSLAVVAPLVRDPSASVRAEVARALGRLGAGAFPSLQTLVHDSDDGVRAAAADALGRGLPPGDLAELVRGTLDDDVVRPVLLASVARLPVDVALPLLEEELKRGNAVERRRAAEQLARFNDPRVYQVLFQIAARDPDDDTRHIATRILGN